MFRSFVITLLSILFITSIARADHKVVGHPTPFPNELLENPVILDCGAVIQEVQAGQDYALLNSMCTHVYSNFFNYIEAKRLRVEHKKPFNWNLSFLSEDTCYRCLNDEEYRFNNRFISGRVIGYTSRNDRYAFMSSKRDSEFNTTFVHELFHSMSMYYGVYDNHPGTWAQKTIADEYLAVEFTEWLGYGK